MKVEVMSQGPHHHSDYQVPVSSQPNLLLLLAIEADFYKYKNLEFLNIVMCCYKSGYLKKYMKQLEN